MELTGWLGALFLGLLLIFSVIVIVLTIWGPKWPERTKLARSYDASELIKWGIVGLISLAGLISMLISTLR